MVKETLIECARSYGEKVSKDYQTKDFFCSLKEECVASKATETSERLFDKCYREVKKSIEKYLNPPILPVEMTKVGEEKIKDLKNLITPDWHDGEKRDPSLPIIEE